MIFAIGDVHGEHELLMRVHAEIDLRLAESPPRTPALIVHLGDLIDRGAHGIACLKAALDWDRPGCRSVVLPGNHEQMLMTFWNAAAARQPEARQAEALRLWVRNGGEAMCREMQVADHGDVAEVAAAIAHSGLAGLLERLRAAPAALRVGRHLFVHAGIPRRPGGGFLHPDEVPAVNWLAEDIFDPWFDPQASPLWVREPFLNHQDAWPEEVIAVHGHTITFNRPEVVHHRIAIDTGACIGGSLTMLEIDGKATDFFSVS